MLRERREDLLSRFRFLVRASLLALLGVGGSYYGVQVVQGGSYRALAESNRLRRMPIDPSRGLLFDREERILVQNVPDYRVLLHRDRSEDIDATIDFVAGVLEVERETLAEDLREGKSEAFSGGVVLAEDLSLKDVARLELAGLEYPALEVQALPKRLYRQGARAAHVLGYLGEVTAEDLDAKGALRAGDMVGRSGVEKHYDDWLRGAVGERVVVVDSRSRVVEEYGRKPARPGRNLKLNLDLDLQREAEEQLEGKAGAVVVMDPRTGDLLAIASSPAYDPNLFSRGLAVAEWRSLADSPLHPLQNRAVRSAYSPGSPFKVVMAIAALEEGKVSPERRIFCRGSARFYNRRFRCWKAAGHGWVDLHKALKESCDVYFYQIGDELGIERIARWARRLGLGVPTGIDLEGERSGLVPDRAWKQRVRGAPWYPGETISVSIGQGPILVTPLQMARLFSVIANGGWLVRPRLSERAEIDRRSVEVSSSTLERVRRALWAVVNDKGTGRRAAVEGRNVAGKTGTVQVVEQNTWIDSEDLPLLQRDHAWFASFAPTEAPEIVVVVFVEHGGKGSVSAAPIAKAIYERHFRKRRVPDPA